MSFNMTSLQDISAVATNNSLSPESERLRLVRITVNVYIVGTLSVLGILGNLVSVLVLGQDQSIRKTTRFLLQMLAVADGVYLIACLFYQTLKTMNDDTDWMSESFHGAWPGIEMYVWPSASIAQTCTVWLVVVVTADRYVAICCPLHAPQYSTVIRARVAVIVVWIGSVLYNIPRFFERTLVERTDPLTNVTRVELIKSQFRENQHYVLVYKTCLFFVVRFLVPFSALAFFNTCLIRAINKSSRRQCKNMRHASADQRQQRANHTRMLVVVVIVFVVCALPDILLRLWISLANYVPSEPRLLGTMRYINVASNAFLTVNSCINFVIYCFMGRKFRTILLRVLLRRRASSRKAQFRELMENRRKSSVLDDSIMLFQYKDRLSSTMCTGLDCRERVTSSTPGSSRATRLMYGQEV